jgi:hypothetical protein
MRGENETARHCTDLQAADEMAEIEGRLSRFLSAAERAVGAQHVLTDAATRELHSVDFSEQRRGTAAAAVRPGRPPQSL